MNKSDASELARSVLGDARTSTKGWSRANCPFCESRRGSADKRSSFAVHPGILRYKCFRCGISGQLDGDADAAALAEHEASRPVDGAIPHVGVPAGFYLLADGPGLTSDVLAPARAFVKRRGLNRALCRAIGIGACVTGYYSGRVIVPIKEPGGEGWLGFVGRAWMDGTDMPYLYPEDMQRDGLFFNHEALTVDTEDPVLVVEGVLDATPYYPHAVACLGKPSGLHKEILMAVKRPMAVVLDGDSWEEGMALAWRLSFEGARAGHVHLPPKTDPNEGVDPHELMRAARACVAGG